MEKLIIMGIIIVIFSAIEIYGLHSYLSGKNEKLIKA